MATALNAAATECMKLVHLPFYISSLSFAHIVRARSIPIIADKSKKRKINKFEHSKLCKEA